MTSVHMKLFGDVQFVSIELPIRFLSSLEFYYFVDLAISEDYWHFLFQSHVLCKLGAKI